MPGRRLIDAVALPSADEIIPLLVVGQVPAEDVGSARGRLPGNAKKRHVRFFWASSTFVMVAGRAGCYYVDPRVQSALVAREYVINSQSALASPAILAGVVVAAEHLAAR